LLKLSIAYQGGNSSLKTKPILIMKHLGSVEMKVLKRFLREEKVWKI
jgi:hypothetical protein